MDLHDFDDVAENYDLYLEEMYRSEDNHAGFLDFYLEFAREYGKDGVIDIACGTGAVLLYLAQHGIYADGTELTGYEIVNVYGGYRKESGDGSAKNVIWCVRKK